MGKKIMITAPGEGFIIKGLETKLSDIGMFNMYCPPVTDEIRENSEGTGLFIIFTDDNVRKYADVLLFIKEFCFESDVRIILVGTKEEHEIVSGYVSENFIHRFFERPLDMEQLVDEVDRYMKEGTDTTERKSILIVDDDVSYMSMIMSWLKGSYRVSMANSGMQAITWLVKNRADLILLDYEMPITPGPQVLEMIRSDATLADIPVMFLTGKGDKESIMKVLALKPVGYVLKTVEKKELCENISKFFSTR